MTEYNYQPIFSNQVVPFTILRKSKLPIRKTLYPTMRCLSTNDINQSEGSQFENSNSKMRALMSFNQTVKENSNLGQMKIFRSTPEDPSSAIIKLPFKKMCSPNYKLKMKASIHRRKTKEAYKNQLIKRLIVECQKIRLSLNEKCGVSSMATSSLVTTPSLRTTICSLACRSDEILHKDEDDEDTLFGLDENIDSINHETQDRPSITSLSLYVNATTAYDNNDEKDRRMCLNYDIKPACISVFEKHFPKLHIICFPATVVIKGPDSCDQRDDTLSVSCENVVHSQMNNSNSTGINVNSHNYFRHAQQLLSNNSSQMQSIVYGTEESSSSKSNKPTIKPFYHGHLAESHEDLSFLTNKLNDNISSRTNEYRDQESNSLPFDRLLENKMGQEKTTYIMTHNDERKNSQLGPALTEFHERKQRERIESQALEYKNMSSNFRKMKSEHDAFANDVPKIMRSPEIMKNNRISYSSEKCADDVEKQPLGEDLETTKEDVNERTEHIQKQNKKVCFNVNVKSSELCDSYHQNAVEVDKKCFLEQQVERMSMMLNNVIRRMNNLEVHFQEFSTLFIRLHKETLEAQSNVGQCCSLDQLNCQRYV